MGFTDRVPGSLTVPSAPVSLFVNVVNLHSVLTSQGEEVVLIAVGTRSEEHHFSEHGAGGSLEQNLAAPLDKYSLLTVLQFERQMHQRILVAALRVIAHDYADRLLFAGSAITEVRAHHWGSLIGIYKLPLEIQKIAVTLIRLYAFNLSFRGDVAIVAQLEQIALLAHQMVHPRSHAFAYEAYQGLAHGSVRVTRVVAQMGCHYSHPVGNLPASDDHDMRVSGGFFFKDGQKIAMDQKLLYCRIAAAYIIGQKPGSAYRGLVVLHHIDCGVGIQADITLDGCRCLLTTFQRLLLTQSRNHLLRLHIAGVMVLFTVLPYYEYD